MFLSVDFISGLIATKFLMLLNHKLLSSETFSGTSCLHKYSVIKISKFCTQTGGMRNKWKFPVAKQIELALEYNGLVVSIQKDAGSAVAQW